MDKDPADKSPTELELIKKQIELAKRRLEAAENIDFGRAFIFSVHGSVEIPSDVAEPIGALIKLSIRQTIRSVENRRMRLEQ